MDALTNIQNNLITIVAAVLGIAAVVFGAILMFKAMGDLRKSQFKGAGKQVVAAVLVMVLGFGGIAIAVNLAQFGVETANSVVDSGTGLSDVTLDDGINNLKQ